MKEFPDISIVVLNWNSSQLLNRTLESIVSTASDMQIDVTVIDNDSTDGGFALVSDVFKNDSRFSFVQSKKNIGFTSINIILQRAHGRYIVILDPEVVLHAGALQSLFAFLEEHPEAGAATAKFLNPDGSPQLYYRRLMTPFFYFFTTLMGRVIDKYMFGLRYFKRYRYQDLDINRISEVEQPAIPCLMVRRALLGPYITDPNMGFYIQDIDLSRRLYTQGYKVYLVPAAAVTHPKSTSFAKRESAWRRREYNRSLMTYFTKHYPLHIPFVWILMTIDRILRMLLVLVTGREPLR